MGRFAIVVAAACLACRGSSTGQGGGPSPMVEPIAREWCQHHFTCGRVAPSKRYRDLETCETSVRKRVADDLRGCKTDDTRVRACVAAIHDKTCDPFRVVTPDACLRLCD